MSEAPDLYIVEFTYVRPLEEIDRAREDHLAHLRRGVDRGIYLVAGALVPRTGGIVLATGDEQAMAKHVDRDPFVERGLATATVKHFRAGTVSDRLTL